MAMNNTEIKKVPEHVLRELPYEETKINWDLVDKIKIAREKLKENGTGTNRKHA